MTMGGNPREIPILSLGFGVISPRDAQSGLPTGQRQWKPIVVTKEWDATSPKLYSAAVSNESLSAVTIEFVDSWLTFKNAKIIDFSRAPRQGRSVESFTFVFEDVEAGMGAAGRPLQTQAELTEVAFIFQKINVSYAAGGKTATDDWSQGG
jgi:type VI secretion system secreted protein Hcp